MSVGEESSKLSLPLGWLFLSKVSLNLVNSQAETRVNSRYLGQGICCVLCLLPLERYSCSSRTLKFLIPSNHLPTQTFPDE